MRKVNRFLSLILCIVLLCSVVPHANAQENRIVRIIAPQGLLDLAENCRLDSYSRDLTVILCKDIDMTGITFSGIPIFNGTFKGMGHTVSGISLDVTGSNVGLFRYLTSSATVQDLHIRGAVNPAGSSSAVGGLVGRNEGTVKNCSFYGTVSGIDSIGGLVGVNMISGIVEKSETRGSVHGNHFVGGIAGDNYGVVRNCKNYAKVNTTVEQNEVELENITLDSIVNSESVSTVTDIGGICGTGTGVIRGCANYAEIGYPQIGYNIGGIAGSYSGYITDCVNNAGVYGRKEVGGIVGQLEPAVNMIYEEDTLQTLQDQMNELSGITGSMGSSIQNSSNTITNQALAIEKELKDAQDALKVLMPDEENPELPDEEAIQAAQNALSSSLSNITSSFSTMSSVSQNTLSSLYGNIQGIAGQMNAISGTIGTASENLGGGIQDVSDFDTDADVTAKIHNCFNMGSVQGDWNIGGIAGAIALENDLDPESDLQIIGNTSLNFDMELRAVVLECENKGTVLGKKQNIGGIAGWVSMGLVKNCVNTAAVDAASADYAGGVAGQSSGYIRSCSAKCTVSGDTYVGGIAGTGTTLTDCRSAVQFGSATEKFGAVLGFMEEATLEGNYYLHFGTDPGAIDGINYDTKAQPLTPEAFFALEDLPSCFHMVSVTFIFDDDTTSQLFLPYGTQLTESLIPEVPALDGSDCVWAGPLSVGENLYSDATFRLESTAHIQVLESKLKVLSGLPQFLLQGEFLPGTAFQATVTELPGYEAAWEVTLPESMAPMKLRCMIPAGLKADKLSLSVKTGDVWTDTPFQVDGSYLVFSVEEDSQAIRLAEIPTNYAPFIYAGIAVIIVAAAVVLILKLRNRKKRKS